MVLNRLCQVIRLYKMLMSGYCIDFASSYRTLNVHASTEIIILIHASCSPDLANLNFFLFSSIKIDIATALPGVKADKFERNLKFLKHSDERLNKRLSASGEYLEEE